MATRSGKTRSSATTAVSAAPVVRSESMPLAVPQKTLECDYDVRPTPLYKAIQLRQWSKVRHLLEDPDSAVQASIWVVRKEPNGQLRWRLLPLHAALIFQAPLEVIEALLEVDPSAAAAKDDQGMLPLHLSLRNRPIQWPIVEELLTAHPAAVYTSDRKGRTPLQGSSTTQRISTASTAPSSAMSAHAAAVAKATSEADENSLAALSVLKLYTQIAVARERTHHNYLARQRDEDVHSVASVETTAALSKLSAQHAKKLTELQADVQLERQSWQDQLAQCRADYERDLAEAEQREGALLKEMDRLQAKLDEQQAQYIALLQQENQLIREQQATPARHQQLVAENASLRHCVADLIEEQAAVLESFQLLREEQAATHEKCMHLLAGYTEGMHEAQAHRQAHFAVCRTQLQTIQATVEDRLGKVGLELEAMARTRTGEENGRGSDAGSETPSVASSTARLLKIVEAARDAAEEKVEAAKQQTPVIEPPVPKGGSKPPVPKDKNAARKPPVQTDAGKSTLVRSASTNSEVPTPVHSNGRPPVPGQSKPLNLQRQGRDPEEGGRAIMSISTCPDQSAAQQNTSQPAGSVTEAESPTAALAQIASDVAVGTVASTGFSIHSGVFSRCMLSTATLPSGMLSTSSVGDLPSNISSTDVGLNPFSSASDVYQSSMGPSERKRFKDVIGEASSSGTKSSGPLRLGVVSSEGASTAASLSGLSSSDASGVVVRKSDSGSHFLQQVEIGHENEDKSSSVVMVAVPRKKKHREEEEKKTDSHYSFIDRITQSRSTDV